MERAGTEVVQMESKLCASGDQNRFKSLLENLNSFRQNKQLCDVEIEVSAYSEHLIRNGQMMANNQQKQAKSVREPGSQENYFHRKNKLLNLTKVI